MARFRAAVEAEVRRRLVDDRGAAAVARTLRRPLPEDVDFLTSSRDQIAAMRTVLEPLTRRLAGRLAAKRRHRRPGTLDFRRTMRASLSTGGVPVRPVFRKPHPAKPELFVLADISGSVSTFAAFTLQLTYALRSQFSRVRSFVFVDGIDEVTDALQQAADVVEATRQINATGSGVWFDGRSDYGHALSTFWDTWGEQVRRRTTVIVLGDARTNYHDPREGALKAVSQRAGHAVLAEPRTRQRLEQRRLGDSQVPAFLRCRARMPQHPPAPRLRRATRLARSPPAVMSAVTAVAPDAGSLPGTTRVIPLRAPVAWLRHPRRMFWYGRCRSDLGRFHPQAVPRLRRPRPWAPHRTGRPTLQGPRFRGKAPRNCVKRFRGNASRQTRQPRPQSAGIASTVSLM